MPLWAGISCGSSCLLASSEGVEPSLLGEAWPHPVRAPSLGGDFREESLAFQVLVQRCGLVYRPLAIRPTRGQEGAAEQRGEEEGTDRRHGGLPGRLARRPRPSAFPRQPPSATGLTFPLASWWAGPTAGSGLPCLLRAALLAAPPALAR